MEKLNESVPRAQAPILENMKINVKIKLSALWVALMFFYLYNDVFGSFRQDQIAGVLSGAIALNQVALFGAATLMAIPIFMIFLSLALPAKLNRRINIITGLVYAVVLVLVMLLPQTWAYYIFYEILEAVFIVLIVWQAWKWPRQEG